MGLFVKVDEEACRKADEFESWLSAKQIRVIRKKSLLPSRRSSESQQPTAPNDLFCVFVLGGDGTFLSAARWIGEHNTPILGVKFGEVGFLAELTEDVMFSAADAILNSEFSTVERMRLLVTVLREGKEIASEPVLNDIVINKGALARLARIETWIDDQYLTTYRADGLIVATPTGSTAYSLAAGGPVIHPSVPAILMTPICPFTLTNRPLIVPDSACVKIRLVRKSSDIMLTFDGQTGMEITEKDTIIVRKSPHPVHMIVMPERHYFEVLKTKLRWSGGRI
ncbi:MAG: NAD(+)/NADH kinase [Desulfococcaceae bacterium]